MRVWQEWNLYVEPWGTWFQVSGGCPKPSWSIPKLYWKNPKLFKLLGKKNISAPKWNSLRILLRKAAPFIWVTIQIENMVCSQSDIKHECLHGEACGIQLPTGHWTFSYEKVLQEASTNTNFPSLPRVILLISEVMTTSHLSPVKEFGCNFKQSNLVWINWINYSN